MKIGLDIMGGDYAPDATIQGAILARQAYGDRAAFVLLGDRPDIERRLKEQGADPTQFEIIHCPETIEMASSPVKSIMDKPESSLSKGFELLKENEISGFASAGNTGAMLVGSVLKLGVIREGLRPCLMSPVPRIGLPSGTLVDVGANADCKPENLVDFALLGSCFSEFILKIDRPKVGLLNIGEEPEKGNSMTIAAHALLAQTDAVNFIGNIEGRHLFTGMADVIVCSGFVGNIVVKMAEGLYSLLKSKGFSNPFLEGMNYVTQGGSPILGVNRPVVVGHGISNAEAIQHMLRLTLELAENNFSEKIKEAIQYV